MGQNHYKNALISVADKTGLVDFVKALKHGNLRIVSTGGTARTLREAGLEVFDVSEQTGFPEIMDGRVKTLHPHIHAALLARGGHDGDLKELEMRELQPFDLVIGNLYPFEKVAGGATDAEKSELIDIGGPSFLRAAAKNFSRITTVCDPKDYSMLLESENTAELRKKLAAKVFQHTASYDAMIAASLVEPEFNDWFAIGGTRVKNLRYGENPQQESAWYQLRGCGQGLHEAEILQGKELSYNNLLDIDSAVRCIREFDNPACVALKHNNPCGVAVNSDLTTAVSRAIKADPVSVFGGIVAINGSVNAAMAESLTSLFLECVIAPDYQSQALDVLAKKKNLRLLKYPGISQKSSSPYELKSILGGFLLQSADSSRNDLENLTVKNVAVDTLPEQILKAAEMAWKTCAHLKSNAIAIASAEQTVGLGMGQVNRVDAVKQAIERMQEFHPNAGEVVLASDAFFPFPDSIELAAEAGIKFVIQPGGSIKDPDVINRAKQLNIGVLLTGVRHFRH